MAVQLNIVGNFDDKELKRAESALARLRSGADSASSGLRQKFGEMGQSVTDLGKKMTTMVTLPLAGLAVYGVKLAGELEDSQAMSKQVFGSWSKQLDSWANGAAENFGLAKGAALDAANQMGIRLRQIGGMTEDAATLTSASLVQFAGDLASAFGGPVEDASAALQSALTGEYEPLKRYGIVINEAALQSEYFALTGKKVKGALSAQQKQQATLSLITKSGSLIVGDFARNADGATNSQKTLTAKLKDAATTIGTILLPYATKIVQWGSDLLERFKKLSPGVQKFIVIAGLLAAALGPLLIILGSMATAVAAISWPVVAVVAIIGALVAAFVIAYKKSEQFRDVINALGRAIKAGFAVVVQWVTQTVIPQMRLAIENLRPVLEAAGQFFQALFARIVQGVQFMLPIWQGVFRGFVAVIQFVWPLIQNQVAAALRMIQGIIQIVTAAISGNWSGAWNGIKNVFGGIWDGIKGIVSFGVGAIRSALSGLLGWVGSAFAGVGQLILAPFRAAIGAFKSLWNSTIGGKGFSLPSWVPGIGGKEFRIPTLHTGGIVPGPVGKEVPAMLQAGEAVLPIQAVRNLAAERQGGGTTYNITVNAGVSDPAEVGRKVVDTIRQYERLNGAGWRAA